MLHDVIVIEGILSKTNSQDLSFCDGICRKKSDSSGYATRNVQKGNHLIVPKLKACELSEE